jgi:ABC-type cobalamin/Fe3+-siderophores transport system ATPase subunit
MNAVEARGIHAGYGRRLVLRGCDISVARGEVVAVVGPNGAGKSTLVRVLAGLIRPSDGDVRIEGSALADLSRTEVARRIAVVPQAFDTLFPFTAREVVALGRTARLDVLGRASTSDRAAVDRALTALGLDAIASRSIDEISGGERQRVVLAMALAQETSVIILDEPTVHLDPGHQLGTIALLRRLARERGLAILAVMHDLNLAALADRIVVVADGRVVRSGTPSSVIDEELLRRVFGAGWRITRHDGRPFVVPVDPHDAVDTVRPIG